MSPAQTPGSESVARLLEGSTIKLVDNRCFCPGAAVPHHRGMPRGCEHFEPVTFAGRGG